LHTALLSSPEDQLAKRTLHTAQSSRLPQKAYPSVRCTRPARPASTQPPYTLLHPLHSCHTVSLLPYKLLHSCHTVSLFPYALLHTASLPSLDQRPLMPHTPSLPSLLSTHASQSPCSLTPPSLMPSPAPLHPLTSPSLMPASLSSPFYPVLLLPSPLMPVRFTHSPSPS